MHYAALGYTTYLLACIFVPSERRQLSLCCNLMVKSKVFGPGSGGRLMVVSV